VLRPRERIETIALVETIATNLTRSAPVKIKLGFKAWSTLAAMLFSVVVVSGCNNEETPSAPAPGSGPAPAAKPTGEAPKPKEPAANPPAPTATEKPKDKDMPK
jgi:hypothetical protein